MIVVCVADVIASAETKLARFVWTRATDQLTENWIAPAAKLGVVEAAIVSGLGA